MTLPKSVFVTLLAASIVTTVSASSPQQNSAEPQLEVTVRGLYAAEVTDPNEDEVFVNVSRGYGQWYQFIGRVDLDDAVGAGWNRDINKVIYRGRAIHPNTNRLTLTFWEDDPDGPFSVDDLLGSTFIDVSRDGKTIAYQAGDSIQRSGHFRGYRRTNLRGSGARYAIFYRARIIQ